MMVLKTRRFYNNFPKLNNFYDNFGNLMFLIRTFKAKIVELINEVKVRLLFIVTSIVAYDQILLPSNRKLRKLY